MNDDDLDRALDALPSRDVGGWRREHVRTRAHAALGATKTARGRRHARWAQLYRQVLEPSFVVTVCAVHLLWAFGTAARLLLR